MAWPDNGRNWCDEARFYYDAPQVDEGEPISVNKIGKIIWRPVAIWPQRAGAYSPNTGMTVLGMRRLRDGTAMWCLWDQNSDDGGNSVATELFDDRALAKSSLFDTRRPTLAVSCDGSRVAYLDPTAATPTVRVIYRNPWERVDSDQVTSWHILHLLGTDEERRDIHRVSNTIRSLLMGFYWCRVPEELNIKYVHGPLTETISKWIKELASYRDYLQVCQQARREGDQASPELLRKLGEVNQDIASWDDKRYQSLVDEYEESIQQYEDAFKKVKQWEEAGSVTAMSVKAGCALKAAWRARGSGMGYQVTRQGATTFEEKCRECEEICLELVKQPRPPMTVFNCLFEAARGTDATHQSVEPLVRRCNRLYPECSSPHTSLGFWLLPRWGGQSGDAASYIDAAISNVSPEMRDKVFAITHIRMADSFSGNVNYFSATGADESRTFRGAIQVLDEEAMANAHWIGPLIWAAKYTSNDAVLTAACEYYRENFAYAFGAVYREFPTFYRPCFADRPRPR